jgi:hypothetical protein
VLLLVIVLVIESGKPSFFEHDYDHEQEHEWMEKPPS